ncbi:MAG: type III-A CRISPR-associated protein Cas10/Csm1, partial [Candidatus Ancillula sp.]|nr:type III-A CRISPR-associated protein Cas10/Csm1 [Candidatus Ancillula sp.]
MSNMSQDLVNVIYGCLLHDLGKVTRRVTGGGVGHGHHGASKLEEWIQDSGKDSKKFQDIIDCVRYHMAGEISKAKKDNYKLDDNSIAYICYIADNIAAGVDRRNDLDDETEKEKENTYSHWSNQLREASIFSLLKFNSEDKQHGYHKLITLEAEDKDYLEPNIPNLDSPNFEKNKSVYENLEKKLKQRIKEIDFDQDNIDSLINVLESICSYVPSSTNKDEIADISLFDHLKMTAALGSCIYLYLEKNKYKKEYTQKTYKTILKTNATAFYKEPVFKLVKIGLSGIQNFIYTIRTKNAAKILRSRSFYVEMLVEILVDELLEEFSLSRVNVLDTGGGSAFLILPNFKNTEKIL